MLVRCDVDLFDFPDFDQESFNDIIENKLSKDNYYHPILKRDRLHIGFKRFKINGETYIRGIRNEDEYKKPELNRVLQLSVSI